MASEKPASRIWYVGNAEFDEGRWELRVAGERRAVESKPLALLHALLCHAGEAVTKAELLEAVWPGVMVVEGSLTTAVSKLRAALGEQGRTIVEAVHGIGYRLGVPCTVRITSDRERFATSLTAGDAVPNRPQWVLERQIGGASASDVWIARHEKTREQRVFKFADTASRLLALRRETDLARVLTRALGERADFLRVLEWNFDSRPYFIETAYGGPDLAAWAAERGGLANVSFALRIEIAARVARIAGAAHGAGVLHRDIKPSNILVEDTGEDLVIRLVDFGSGRLTDAALLSSLSISGLALTADPMATSDGAGLTLRYMAPELMHGGLPSIAADVYALGILLYEMVLGDLGRPLAAGWEADIADPLLRQDIAAAAAGDPSRRLASATLLADRLDTLAARRSEHHRQEEAEAASRDMAARVERMRARRPWLVTAAAVVLVGAVAVGIAEVRAERRGSEAAQQAAIAQAENHFLTDDLLARGDPERAGKADETLMEAASRAESDVDTRFGTAPLIAAQIHLALADAFDRRSAYTIARNAYRLAIADFTRAQGPNAADTVIATLRLATMEAFTEEAGGAARAQALLTQTDAPLSRLAQRRDEAQVWRLTCEGGIAVNSGHADRALPLFTQAADLAGMLPAAFDESRRLWLRENEARSLVRLARWSEAETLFKALLPRQVALHGPRDADSLLIELTMAQALMARGESAQAEAALDRLYPLFVSVYGPTHRLTQRVLGARAQVLGQLGRYDEAIRDDQVLYQLAVAGRGAHSWPAIAVLSDVAESQCRSGRGEAGLATARQASAAALASFGAGSAQAMAMTGEVAFCMIVAGHAADAEPLIDSIDPKALSQLGAGPDFPAQLDVMRAAVALSEHDPARARYLLKAPSQIFARPDADPYVQRWTLQLVQLSK